MNRGLVYGLWDYKAQSRDELSMRTGDRLTVLRRDEDADGDWWLARCGHRRGFVPRNLLGVSNSSGPAVLGLSPPRTSRRAEGFGFCSLIATPQKVETRTRPTAASLFVRWKRAAVSEIT